VRPIALCLAALLPLAAAGCGDDVEEISSSHYMLDLLDRYWQQARQAVETGSEDLNCFRPIQINLNGRVLGSVEDSYEGDNKAEVVAKLKAFTETFNARLLPLLNTSARAVCLRKGVTRDRFAKAFAAADDAYRRLEQLTKTK